MKFKFSATVIVQLSGEAEGNGDNFNVFTEQKCKVIPTFMTAQSDGDIEELDDDSSKLIFAVLTNNVLSRAHQETRIPGVTVGVPIPAVIDTPEGSRN